MEPLVTPLQLPWKPSLAARFKAFYLQFFLVLPADYCLFVQSVHRCIHAHMQLLGSKDPMALLTLAPHTSHTGVQNSVQMGPGEEWMREGPALGSLEGEINSTVSP